MVLFIKMFFLLVNPRLRVTRTTFSNGQKELVRRAREFLSTQPIAEGRQIQDFPVIINERLIPFASHTCELNQNVIIEQRIGKQPRTQDFGVAVHEFIHAIDRQTRVLIPEHERAFALLKPPRIFLPWNFARAVKYKMTVGSVLEGRAMLYESLYYEQAYGQKALEEFQRIVDSFDSPMSKILTTILKVFFGIMTGSNILAFGARGDNINLFWAVIFSNSLGYLIGMQKYLGFYSKGYKFMRKFYDEHREVFIQFEKDNVFFTHMPTKKEIDKCDVDGYIRRVITTVGN